MNATAVTTNESGVRTELSVRGMTCQNCARHVREALQNVPGVSTATVNLDAQRATVRWATGTPPNIEAAEHAVKEAGYEAAVVENRESKVESPPTSLSGWGTNLAIGIPVTAVLLLGEWVFGLAMERWFQWLAFALATLVQFIGGARFYRGAWQQLKARSSNMDTLVALGSTTAYAYSVWALFQHTHVYFMEAAAIITLISVGHWLESRMSARAASSMRKLLALAPAQARRRNTDGSEELVPISELHVGDIVVLRPGERVPTDGEVIEGESSVDEAMLTGESVPVDKAPGALVYGGTANLNRLLAISVTATGDATALAQIITAVERAQNSRANIQRLGDRVSSVFVPIVIVIAIATALWWGLAPESAAHVAKSLARFLWPVSLPATALAAAIIHCAAVLIIACPCAMGLATPVAIMAGTNAAAERGILIRDGVALEKAGTINAIVFDKTGTLTHGKPEVVDCKEFTAEIDPLALAAAMADHSNHPLSQAISKWIGTRAHAVIQAWQERSGSGVEAIFNSRTTRLGSVNWLAQAGIALTPGAEFIEHWTAQGATIVGLAVEQELTALFALQDTVKNGAANVVSELRQAGRCGLPRHGRQSAHSGGRRQIIGHQCHKHRGGSATGKQSRIREVAAATRTARRFHRRWYKRCARARTS